jgi:hypothetical protein
MTKKPGPMDDIKKMVPINESDLKVKVVRALNLAGMDWVEDVKLQWYLRVPNWRISGFTGTPPNDAASVRALSHPAIVELQKQYALMPPKPN